MTPVTDPSILSQLNASAQVTDPAILSQLNNNEVPESQFWHSASADDPKYQYGDILPFKKNTSTGEVSLSAPEMLRSVGRGIGDLYQQAETKSIDATPDSIGAMMGLSAIPGAAESMATKIGASLANKTPRAGFLESNSSDPMLAQKPLTPTSAEVRALSSKTFSAADAAGGNLKPNVTNGWIDTSKQLLPQTPAAQIVFGQQTPAEQLIGRLEGMRDRPLSLAETQELDSRLGDLAHDNIDPNTGKLTAEGEKYHQIQQNLRDAWGSATEADTVGGKEGFDLAKDARGLWATSAKMNDIERIMARANLMPNPSTGAMTGFRNLSLNPSRMAGYLVPEKEAISNAATVGLGTKMVRAAGNHIVAPMVGAGIGGIMGGETGAMLGTGVGASVAEAAKTLAGKMQLAKGKNVLDMLANRPVVQKAMFPQMGDSTQQLIADSLMKSKEADMPVGEIGKALAKALRGEK